MVYVYIQKPWPVKTQVMLGPDLGTNKEASNYARNPNEFKPHRRTRNFFQNRKNKTSADFLIIETPMITFIKVAQKN